MERSFAPALAIIVENGVGDKRRKETVYLPAANGPVIGTVRKLFKNTDILLAQLQTGIRYAAHTFGFDLEPSINAKSSRKPA